jgi:hypothetical protein
MQSYGGLSHRKRGRSAFPNSQMPRYLTSDTNEWIEIPTVLIYYLAKTIVMGTVSKESVGGGGEKTLMRLTGFWQ